ncbi:MAG: glycoside hydrolase family 99-like domain-containing protein [Thermodesulfobacteriota bacterium]
MAPPQWPALGQYDASDLKAVEKHIAWSSQYGVHFWAVSWWPDHPELDRKLHEKILRAKNIDDIKFCIFYETAGLGLADDRITFTPDKIKKMVSDFKYLAQNYFSHPSYLKIKGRPVVIIYLTRTFSGDYPQAINNLRASLKKMGFNPYLIGDEIFWYVIRSAPLSPSTHPNMNRIKLFDAITAYNMYDWAKPKQMGYGSQSTFLFDVHTLYQEYQSAIGKEINFIPAIIPGYNDRGVRLSENHPVIPRQFREGDEEGSFFSQALKQTVVPFIDPNLSLALITSFNEWNEGTQIEPTVESAVTRKDRSPSKTDYTQGYAYRGYGEKYLSILQDTFVAINGRVVEDKKKGSPLPKVYVKAFKGDQLMAAVLTDRQGFFNLSRFNLPPDDYELRVNISGYQEIRTKIRTDEKKTINFNFGLKKDKAPRS